MVTFDLSLVFAKSEGEFLDTPKTYLEAFVIPLTISMLKSILCYSIRSF